MEAPKFLFTFRRGGSVVSVVAHTLSEARQMIRPPVAPPRGGFHPSAVLVSMVAAEG